MFLRDTPHLDKLTHIKFKKYFSNFEYILNNVMKEHSASFKTAAVKFLLAKI